MIVAVCLLISAPLKNIKGIFFGYVFDMASKGAQRIAQGLQKEVLGGEFEGMGGDT